MQKIYYYIDAETQIAEKKKQGLIKLIIPLFIAEIV